MTMRVLWIFGIKQTGPSDVIALYQADNTISIAIRNTLTSASSSYPSFRQHFSGEIQTTSTFRVFNIDMLWFGLRETIQPVIRQTI